MIQKNIHFTIKEYNNINELPSKYADLVNLAIKASKKAYAPYSNFYVGAALMLENGEIITGNNQENAAYPSGLCAERVALFYANAQFPNVKVNILAIAAHHKNNLTLDPITPCGSCRQVILESQFRQQEPITLILAGKNKILVIEDASLMLPLHFSKDSLL